MSDIAEDVEADNNGHYNDSNADIVEATASHRGVDVVLTVRVVRPTDPATTRNWASPVTFAGWELDTNGDDLFDYQILFRRNAGGVPVADVYRINTGTQICTGAATLGSQREYTATVPAGCLGTPTSFRWASFMSWSTNPDDPAAPRAHDNAPGNGTPHAGPVGAP